jgi:CMP-N-acetylneuraminic acid synthetase
MNTTIIPARSGSKRIPNKNVKELRGLPLMEHTIITALLVGKLDRIVISSDDYRWVADKYKRDGVEYLERPKELAADNVPDQPLLEHAVNVLRLSGNIVYLRPTTPYRAVYHLENAIRYFELLGDKATGLRSVEIMSESAFKCYVKEGAELKPITMDGSVDATNKPNQDVQDTYKPNGYIDIAKVDEILAGNLWGNSIAAYITPHTPEIDTPEDWDYAQWFGGRWLQY